ncbi:hypothetical protein [Rhodanobacter sp. KK11]|jgi:hypothetical protein|uniref:hypothetical protein n=1 Tax=Rhodanobacter sp. KK11 TaxID=3083255 RepID=UPI00296642A6|nr:hypothetical protein [Rhodanobacter sp. KK11]MDW2981768.1 hypothetical protein [Rhodanobacter sp. KK11]
MLALMARVARVREIQSRQALAKAIEQEDAQRARTCEAQLCVDRSDAALHDALRGPAIALARLPLLQELSAHVQATLVSERARLGECEEQVVDRTNVASGRMRRREMLDERTGATMNRHRQVDDMRQLDIATEAWLAYRRTEAA